MYRLTGPKLIIFIPLLIIGIIITIITPKYFGVSRILSLSSILIAEAGMSFIPVLALYPKARLVQAIILATIYFFTTLIMCFSSWFVSILGLTNTYAFTYINDEFHINTYSLLVTNLVSLVLIVTNFRLVYDEELTKEFHQQGQRYGYKQKPQFTGFPRSVSKQPSFQGKTTFPASKKETSNFEEDFGRPFEFEPEITINPENLPEESSGKLFSPKETKKKSFSSEFFDDEGEGKTTTIYTESKPIESVTAQKSKSPFPPSNIKDDLALIFEQYSSLDAVKKLTSVKSQKSTKSQEDKKDRQERRSKKPYDLPKETSTIKVHIEDQSEDVHEASFRQINEEEKLEQIKEELKKELQDKIQERVNQEAQKIEETAQKASETKEDIIQSIKNIKQELIESIKEEIKKEFIEQVQQETTQKDTIKIPEESVEELKIINENLTKLNKEQKITGSMYLDLKGNLISENWKKKQVLHEEIYNSLSQLFNSVNKQVNNTNQGNLLHILLESENGMLVLAGLDNKIITVCSSGTCSSDSGQILRSLSEITE